MLATLCESGRDIWAYRGLLLSLIARDLRVRYKQSIRGVIWAVLTPLIMMTLFTVFAKAKILNVDTGDVPYVVFAYCGILPWTFFSSSMTAATSSLVGNKNLLTKVYFPREVFPLASIGSKFIDFVTASGILVVLMLWYRIPIRITVLALPLLFTTQLLLMVGLGLLLAMGNLFYRDVKYMIEAGMTLWMFATSVVYPIEFSHPALRILFSLNPMTPILNGYRSVLILGQWPELGELGVAVVISCALFLLGAVWFHRQEFVFAERV